MKILIIEDDLKIINFLKKGLEEECYVVDFATNGDEGLYLAQHQYWLHSMKKAIQAEKELAKTEAAAMGEIA